MCFLGREKELRELEMLYEAEGFQMLIMYGRRRIGKSLLLEKFVQGKQHIFFTAVENNARQNLHSFEESIFQVFPMGEVHPHFSSFEEALSFIGENAADQRLVVIIDEYPYLAMEDRSASSVLQKCIDKDWIHRNVFLILCGSSISFMEDEVLSAKSALFGRRTAQLNLQPFGYEEAALFVPDYTPQEKLIAYAVTGGVAKYLALLDSGKDIYENIIQLYFSETGYLFEEPQNLLRQEFQNISLYNSIITAMANGSVSVNEIAQKSGISTASLSQAMKRLIAVRIVNREVPILNKNKRYVRYLLSDGVFAFWYRFVLRGITAIGLGFGKDYFEMQVKQCLNDFMAEEFERVCRRYALKLSMTGRIATGISEVGKWMGNDNVQKETADIDVVGLNTTDHLAVIGECKFRNEPMDVKTVARCLDRARLLPGYHVSEYLMFSKGGYKESVKEVFADQPVYFFELEDLYG